MFFNDICVFTGPCKLGHIHIRINKLTLEICKNNRIAILLPTPMAKKFLKKFKFENEKFSGQYGIIKLKIKTICVIEMVLSYHLRHHCVCLCKNLHVCSTFAVI